MVDEFNLSEKEIKNNVYYHAEDIKEFIRLFKLEIDKEKIIEDFMVSRKEIFAIMDKLAGDKLI